MKKLGILEREPFALARSGAGEASLVEAIRRRAESRIATRSTYPWLDRWLDVAASEQRFSPRAIERGRAAARGDAVVVLAGQQPALWGGPLYTLYKTLSAVAVAEWIEERLRIPAVAVFWMVGDDADFGEVSTTWIPAADGRPVKVRDDTLPPSGTRIGTLSAERQARALPAMSAAWAAQPHAAEIDALLASLAAEAGSWSGVQSALLSKLVPDAPLLVLDGDDGQLLEAGRSFLLEASSKDLRALLEEGARTSREIGLEPSFEAELGTRVLFRLVQDRREPWTSGETPERVAPNVVLRPLLQDRMLPNVVTICGPSEVAYRMQLGPIYRALDVPEPVRLPRLAGLLVPQGLDRLCPPAASSSLWELYRELIADPVRFVEQCVEAEHPRALLDEVRDLRTTVRGRVAHLATLATSYDAGLPQLIESAAGKADYQLDRIEDAFLNKARQRTLRAHPLLVGLSELVAPRGKEQERVLSLLTPFVTEGWDASRELYEDARRSVRTFLDAAAPRLSVSVFLLEGWNQGGKS